MEPEIIKNYINYVFGNTYKSTSNSFKENVDNFGRNIFLTR